MKGTRNMQLKDLVKPLDQMTDDELMTRLRTVRHSRETIRPAARKRVERVEVKAARLRVTTMDKMLEGMSDSEREDLLTDVQMVEQQLKKREPNRAVLAALLEPLSRVASIGGFIADLVRLLNP